MEKYFTKKTNLGKFITQLNKIKTETTNILYNTEYEPKNRELQPFLSVIIRTQGNRLHELREVFLCLSAQTNTNFEVILIGHKLNKETKVEIFQIVNHQIPWLKNKIFFVNLSYGNRTTPLNLGFSLSRGKYISIFDDDDLVFANWVDEFYKSSVQNDGMILHAYSATQEWSKIYNSPLQNCLRAENEPNSIYCHPYNWISQLSTNTCPPISLSFPSYIFKHYNIQFDEELTTTEDWDFLLRTSMFTGVSDIKKVTSIYRKWKNAENSTTVHSKEEWVKNYKIIQNKISNYYYVFSVTELQGLNLDNFNRNIKKLNFVKYIWQYIKLHHPVFANHIKHLRSKIGGGGEKKQKGICSHPLRG